MKAVETSARPARRALVEASPIAADTLPKAGQSFYLPELDLIRCFAFLSVFVFHLSRFFPRPPAAPESPIIAAYFLAGSFGVDLFFVLSAYLITELLLRERTRTGTIDVKAFYVRRILRIWPLYFVFLIFALVLSIIWPALFAIRAVYLVASFLMVGNIAMAVLGQPLSVIDALWSISVEEQFYLFWPLVVRRVSARGLVRAALGLIAVATLARIVSWRMGIPGMSIWYSTLTRLDPIAIGILLATIPRDALANLGRLTRAGLFAAGVASWLLNSRFGFPWGASTVIPVLISYPAVALGCGAILIAALGVRQSGPAILLNRPMIYMGKISYGLYVYHLFALAIGRLLSRICFRRGWDQLSLELLYLAASIALTLGLAAASYRWLEAPFLRLKSRFTYVASRPV